MNFDKYKNELPHPDKADYTTVYQYEKGVCVFTNTQKFCRENQISFSKTTETVVDEEAYKEARRVYYAESNRLVESFKSDLEEEYGTQDNPKKDLLFSKAWDHGHSGGFSEVESVYGDLVDLIY